MIPQVALIERWENVLRVLSAMPEHDRQKHWDMSQWGELTECGTVACAAGQCGLDPWFQERRFKLEFDQDGRGSVPDVNGFFGFEGSGAIFLNSARRPVEAVIDEVSAFVGDLEYALRTAEQIGAPPLGELWPEQGGHFSGVMRGRDGDPGYALIAGPEFDGYIDWNGGMKWASELKVEQHRDFTLPYLTEMRRSADTVRHLYKREAYWSCEQRAAISGGAWGQYFDDGSQGYWYEDLELRARGVRRLIIH